MLYMQVQAHCQYELRKAAATLSELPAYATDRDRQWAVRKAFLGTSGEYGWGIGDGMSVEVTARGIYLDKLTDDTSGRTYILERMTWADVVEMVGMNDIISETETGQMKFKM